MDTLRLSMRRTLPSTLFVHYAIPTNAPIEAPKSCWARTETVFNARRSRWTGGWAGGVYATLISVVKYFSIGNQIICVLYAVVLRTSVWVNFKYYIFLYSTREHKYLFSIIIKTLKILKNNLKLMRVSY